MDIGKFKVCMNDFKSMKKPKNVIILGFSKYVLIEQHRQEPWIQIPVYRLWIFCKGSQRNDW